MWNFYDELCTGIPSGIRVEDCVVGEKWTAVRANGRIGVARTMGADTVDAAQLAQSVVGTYLRDAANWMKWKSLTHASIGVAAMNAFYNRADRVEEPGQVRELSGKSVALIGDLPDMGEELENCCMLPLPESEHLDAAYEEAMKRDYVFISGDALINRTLPALLRVVGADTKVSLVGMSVPAASVLFSFGMPLDNLSGACIAEEATMEDFADHLTFFSINPQKPAYLHESTEVTRYENSPYKATKFNSAFNPWEGKDYDKETWSPLFKG